MLSLLSCGPFTANYLSLADVSLGCSSIKPVQAGIRHHRLPLLFLFRFSGRYRTLVFREEHAKVHLTGISGNSKISTNVGANKG